MEKKNGKRVEIPYRYLVAASYLYIIIPIAIFCMGWLKTGFGLLFTGTILAGLSFAMKGQFKDDTQISLPLWAILIIVAVVSLWVYCAGVGGFWPQKADWHWRNALLRDLTDYSWPVVYPETGTAMVYYILYFLAPALAGKMLGWTAANIALLLWTAIGISICILLCGQHII